MTQLRVPHVRVHTFGLGTLILQVCIDDRQLKRWEGLRARFPFTVSHKALPLCSRLNLAVSVW